jgi:hypothetical protein
MTNVWYYVYSSLTTADTIFNASEAIKERATGS